MGSALSKTDHMSKRVKVDFKTNPIGLSVGHHVTPGKSFPIDPSAKAKAIPSRLLIPTLRGASDGPCCPMRNSDQMTIEKTQPTL